MQLRLGKVAKAPIIIRENLLIYAGIFCGITAFQSGLTAAGKTLLYIIAIMSCVLLHEIGHTLAGRRFGVRTRSIELNFYGGLAGADPYDWYLLMDRPKHSLIIWLCGPLVNLGLFGICTAALYLVGNHPIIYSSLDWIRWFNIWMGCFNLLPLYPTDGGGILYSICRFFTTKQRAIKIASWVSMVGCLALVPVAIKFHAFIGIFILIMLFLAARRAPKSDLFHSYF